jgi:hypothetical protein
MHVNRGFSRAKVPYPWRHVMVACLIPEPDVAGRRLEAANQEAIRPGGRIDTILDMTRPLVILACGKRVRDYLPRWSASTRVPHVEPIYVEYPIDLGPQTERRGGDG